jgi:hypothetical protein
VLLIIPLYLLELELEVFFGQFCYFSYDFLDLYLILDFVLISFVLFGF